MWLGLFIILCLLGAIAMLKPWRTADKKKFELTSVVTTKTDTVYVERELIKTVYAKAKKYKSIPLRRDTCFSTRSHYSDTVVIEDNLSVHYDASLIGSLDTISLGVIDKRPLTIIRDSITVTNTITKYPSGLFLGGQVGTQGIKLGGQYVKDKHSIGIDVNPFKPTDVSATYKYRLF